MPDEYKHVELSLSIAQTDKLQKIAQLYEAVKSIILFGEEISPNNYTLPQILKELRDAFDHLMRVVAAKTGAKENTEPGYIETNLDNSFSHVYRCAYDALDWISIVLRSMIQSSLRGYSVSAISAVIPEYYPKIKPRLDNDIPRKIAEIRGQKDIGTPNFTSITEYANCIEELKQYWDTIVKAKSSLIDCKKRERIGKWIERLIAFLIGAAVTGLGVWLTLFYT
jgi:hypothetical protein